MTIANCKDIYGLIDAGNPVEAARLALKLLNKQVPIKHAGDAWSILRNVFQSLLDNEMYLHAASLQWGGDKFSAEPECVKRIFDALHKNSKVLFCGASSMGKSFSAGVWMYLDWRRDPYYTSIKCVGISEDQVRKHVFSHIARMHRICAIPMEQEVIIRDSDMWMGIKGAGNEFGITAIAYKQSEETSGGLRGYKSMPVRPRAHPKFGFMSRLRIIGDEGNQWPAGPFKGLNTIVSQISDIELVKISISFNPESVSQDVVILSEPEQGWNVEDIDWLYDWQSKAGWWVCRLDAAKSENVLSRKSIYPGIQTYDGYMGYLKGAGDSSPSYFIYARGFPPVSGTINTIIPPNFVQKSRGEAIFAESPIDCAAVDLAFMGQDMAQMAIGRWGLASGWRDQNGKTTIFEDRLNPGRNKPRYLLQIDQIVPMLKHDDTVAMAQEIMGRCKELGIKPEWVAVDKTGYGFGTWSHLVKVWGDVVGIGWNEKATERKITAEDQEGADKQVDGVMSEMWWAFRRWLDPRMCAVLINPIIPANPLNTQLTSRRYKNTARGIKIESKEEYKARNQKSPDEADSIIQLVHLVRKNSDIIPGLVEAQVPRKDITSSSGLRWISVGKWENTEADDSISESAPDKTK